MTKHLKLEGNSKDVLKVLNKYGLNPESFGVALDLGEDDFNEVGKDHPNLFNQDLILKTFSEDNGQQWFVQIRRKLTPKDFSLDALLESEPNNED